MQAMWRWLLSAYNGIDKKDRSQLLNSFKSLVYADSASSLAALYNRCVDDPVAIKYPKFLHHLKEVCYLS